MRGYFACYGEINTLTRLRLIASRIRLRNPLPEGRGGHSRKGIVMSKLGDAFEQEGQIENIPVLMAAIQRKVREFSLARFSQNGRIAESRYQYIAVIKADDRDPEVQGAYNCHVYKVPKFLGSADHGVNFQEVAEISVQKEYFWMQYSFGCNGYEDNGDLTIVVMPNEIESFIGNFTARVMPLIADPEDRFLIGLARHAPEIRLIRE